LPANAALRAPGFGTIVGKKSGPSFFERRTRERDSSESYTVCR
jgi:hypothetical protein